MASEANKEPDPLFEGAAARLRERLPSSWGVDVTSADAGRAIEVTAPNRSSARFAVVARHALAPRDVSLLLAGIGQARSSADPLLLIAQWLSPGVQRLLAAQRVSYVDLTGNVRVQLDDPALFVSSAGAERNPQPGARGKARVRGPKAGRLIRVLVDTRPPYRVRELAAAAGLAPGYVSRMLDTLDREALIERGPRGEVESVDVSALLRRWTENYDVLGSNQASGFLSPAGASAACDGLGALADGPRLAVTGSFAAVQLAPVAAPTQLFVYCDDVAVVARALGLLPADEAPDVVVLRPFDDVVWAGLRRRTDGTQTVAPSQIVADCMTGTGRMPAEGEAVLEWMLRDEQSWRHDALVPLSVAAE